MKQWTLTELTSAVEEELKAQGFSPKTIQMYHYLGIVPIVCYYDQLGKDVYSSDETNNFVAMAQNDAVSGIISDTKRRIIRKTAVMLAEYAKDERIVWRTLASTKFRQLTEPFASYLDSYEHKLLANGYQATTIRGYKPIAKYFLHYLEERGITDARKISQDDILAYLSILSEKYTRTGDILSILRSFLTFLHTEHLLSADFVPLLRVNTAKRHKYYFGFTKHEVDEILSAVDRNTSCGKRDYAILTLAVQTGLRAMDVLGLRFGDIDWKTRELRITQHKTERRLILPLGVVVCNVVADYILNERPDSDSPYIFLRSRTPHRKLESWSGYAIVKRAAAKAGITWVAEDHKGFHSFRRSLGNWMLEAEIPLSTISEILGHAKVDSSKPYILTHHSKLAMCARTLQGIETMRRELL